MGVENLGLNFAHSVSRGRNVAVRRSGVASLWFLHGDDIFDRALRVEGRERPILKVKWLDLIFQDFGAPWPPNHNRGYLETESLFHSKMLLTPNQAMVIKFSIQFDDN
ncbi:unnamed protein product [Dovyalis caffra]|uniref:Uncharacterized protein n=1 Tax=Dovyalis caffra TaxID=77055 RepID=A0AAV1RKB4_9ROSI|nr:unnamed protein product [Dovyalis caffra]